MDSAREGIKEGIKGCDVCKRFMFASPRLSE
jgi:hypothetical protein